ncbi:NfeD family protein [Sphingomonas sp.]|uniref:NfeD family protein n=1 Tax=Sphingomonas sp. TaxID=28214 RepID=UPI003B3BCF5C
MTTDWEWAWLVGGVVLAIAELAVPGIFLIWIGAAAILTGFATMAFGPPLPAQLGLFAALAVLAVYLSRHVLDRVPIISDDPLLNEGTARLIGRVVTVVEPIERGEGRVRVGDGVWTATGPDASAGTRVEIIRAIGARLVVEPLPPSEPVEPARLTR